MKTDFNTKADARAAIWDALEDRGVARFPFPPHGRIPNYDGAEDAAKRLFETEVMREAERIKVNPDAPQRFVRIEGLERGCTMYVPTPRLRGGFKRLDPTSIPDEDLRTAASLSNMDTWAEPVELEALPQLDAIVTGSVAVTQEGRRCGKGEGYSDLEYAILRELGHDPVPVATTVHSLQIVDQFPTEAHDVPLSCIATPNDTIMVDQPASPPTGIEWSALSESDLEEMPVLETLRERLS